MNAIINMMHTWRNVGENEKQNYIMGMLFEEQFVYQDETKVREAMFDVYLEKTCCGGVRRGGVCH